MDLKIDMFLRFGEAGATETLYAQAANFDAGMNLADQLAARRAKLFPALTKMEGVRVSDVNFKRDSKVLVSEKWGGKTFSLEETDLPFVSQYIRLNSTNVYWRSYHISGIPDAIHTGILVESALKPAWDKAVKEYIQYLIDTPFYIRALDRTTVGVPKPIQAVSQPDPDGLVTITVTAHGYSNLEKVRLAGATGIGMEYINGVRTIFGVTNDTFKVNPTVADATYHYTGNGTSALRRYTLQPITDGTMMGLRSRQRGHGNFLRQQGSRKRQACRP